MRIFQVHIKANGKRANDMAMAFVLQHRSVLHHITVRKLYKHP